MYLAPIWITNPLPGGGERAAVGGGEDLGRIVGPNELFSKEYAAGGKAGSQSGATGPLMPPR